MKKFNAPAPKDRAPALSARRNLKMARSAHAYVRGSTVKFYEWLDSASAKRVPQGPAVWICGDCHVGNIGPVASAAGKVALQIRDLDQTVIGNPAHDLIRLGLSLATAVRGSDLPGVTTAEMMEQMTLGYEQCFAAHRRHADDLEEPHSVQAAMKEALRRKWKHLARERIEDTKPSIPLGKRFWPLSADEKKAIGELFADRKTQKLVTQIKSRDDDAALEVLDAAYWMKGCSSLGGLRYAVLLDVGAKDGSLCLMDIKEAAAAAAPHYAKSEIPRDNAERVVEGARHLSPHLGERMRAARFMGHSVYLRELMPQDLKLEMEHLTREQTAKAARYLATVVGQAHARQMDAASVRKWRNELKRNRSKSLDAPSWLWLSIVELMATHEAAYLEHCRRFAEKKV